MVGQDFDGDFWRALLASMTGADVRRTEKRWLFTLPVGEPNASPLILTTN
jgi:hypothetical protein